MMRDLLSKRMRQRRDRTLRKVIINCPRRIDGKLRILDTGGRETYWKRVGYDFLISQNVQITVANVCEDEIYREPNAPAGLFVEEVANGCNLPYADKSFDLCHSNSVIEHVGGWDDMQAFARETRRVAYSYFCQTPNYHFPIEPHFPLVPFNHWMPREVRATLMMRLPIAYAGRAGKREDAYEYIDSARLLRRSQMEQLFPEADLKAEWLLGLPKSYTAIHLA